MLRNRVAPLGALILALLLAGGMTAPASGQEVFPPFATVNEAPEGAKVVEGEHIAGTEFSNTRPLASGAVGPLPVFFADDEFGCGWATATASGLTEWIGVARRGMTAVEGLDRCPGFQTKFISATAAGADALIVVNWEPGHQGNFLAIAPIPGVMLGNADGNRLIESLDAEDPESVKLTLEVLDPDTFLPPGEVLPTTVEDLTGSAADGTLSVTGKALFRGETAVVLGEDSEGDPPLHPDLARLGLDATEIALRQPDPDTQEIEFIVRVTQLDMPPPPEVVRYLWQFRVGGKEYWIQAKTSDITTVTAFADDPQGTVQHIPGSFRLRGNCQVIGVVSTCVHLAWLEGVFDTGKNEVRVRLPLGLGVAPEFVPGATIEPEDGMTASIQLVVSNATTSDTVAQEETYRIPEGKSVVVGLVPAGAPAAFTTPAALAPNGTFSADLDVSGLAPGEYDLWSKACFGTNCGTGNVSVTL